MKLDFQNIEWKFRCLGHKTIYVPFFKSHVENENIYHYYIRKQQFLEFNGANKANNFVFFPNGQKNYLRRWKGMRARASDFTATPLNDWN